MEKQLFNNSKNFVVTVKQKLSFTPSVGASMQSGTVAPENGGIDLVASDAAVAQTIFATEPVGNPGKVQLTALNKGNVDAPATKMRVTCQRSGGTSVTNAANTSCPSYLSGIADVPPLKAGATTILNWPPPTPQSWESGTYQLTFELNYDHKTSELNGYYENNRRSFTLFVWPKKETHSVSRTITPQIVKPLAVVPKITMQELIPSHWAPGKEYTLNLIGENLTKDILFSFENGVSLERANVIDSHHAQLQISVSKRIESGKKRLLFKPNAAQGQFEPSGLYGWVNAPLAFSEVPKFTAPKVDLTNFTKGKIKLMSPKFGTFGQSGDVSSDYGIPQVNDQSVFEWREENPGVAESFELRIVNKKNEVLLSKVTGSERSYRADPDFVYQLIHLMLSGVNPSALSVNKSTPVLSTSKGIAAIGGRNASQKPITTDLSIPGIGGSNTGASSAYMGVSSAKKMEVAGVAATIPLSPEAQYLKDHNKDIDLYWTVVGKRSYTKSVSEPGGSSVNDHSSGKSKTETVEVVVEESEKWPLRIDNFTTGMSCGNDRTSGSIQLVNLDFGKGKAPGETQTLDYVGDRMNLTGTLSLDKTPWAFTQHQQNGSVVVPNLFVSWGDGVVEPLKFTKMGTYYTDTSALKIENMQHIYGTNGKYIVRVFMLPEGDVQHNDPSEIVRAYDSYSASKTASAGNASYSVGGNDPYMQTLGYAGEIPMYDSSKIDAAGRAYMLYCKNQTIDPRKDLVAGGTLHLDSIEITGTNGSGNASAGPIKLSAGKKPVARSAAGKIKLLSVAQSGSTVSSGSISASGLGVSAVQPVTAALNLSSGGSSSEVFSRCDVMQANAALRYYGKGNAKFSWILYSGNDTQMVLSSTGYIPVGPSNQRENMTLETSTQPSEESYSTYPIDSPTQEMESFTVGNQYKLSVNAIVDLSTTMALTQEETLNALKEAADKMQQSIPKFASTEMTPQMLKIALGASQGKSDPYLSQIASSGVEIGVLSPSKHASIGMPTVASISRAITHTTGAASAINLPETPHQKPYYVRAEPYRFSVHETTPEKPCKFRILSKSGDEFWIRNISDSVTAVGSGSNKFKGKGDLVIPLNLGGSVEEKILPVTINNWTIESDGMTVAKGTQLKETFSGDNTKIASGMKMNPKEVSCSAQTSDMKLTMDVTAQDNTLRLGGSDEPISWNGVSSKLDGEGNWYYVETKKKEFAIGWSGFNLTSQTTAIDLSSKEGNGLSSVCGGGGASWTGIHLGSATLKPNTFGLIQNNYQKTVTDWGIKSDGLCGAAELGKFEVTVGEGTIGFDSLHAEARGGKFSAEYHNMDVYAPWLDTHLKGEGVLEDGEPGKESGVSFKGLHAAAVSKSYGPVSFTADNLIFGSYEGIGWGVWSDTTLTLKAKNKTVTDKALLNGWIYGMDGRAHLLSDATAATIPLGGKAEFGGTPVDLVSADLLLHPKGGKSLVDIKLNTSFTISEVMPSVSVPVGYVLERSGNTYGSKGPEVKPFDVSVAFPPGQPNVESKITVNYNEEPAQMAGRKVDAYFAGYDAKGQPIYSDVPLNMVLEEGVAYASNEPIYLASGSGATADDQYTGLVDMSMFGGVPIKAEFRLGYKGGHDYWLMRATLDTGGVTFVPPILALYKIRGGLGHNFPMDAFAHVGTINDVFPQMDNSYMFMAGLRVGSTDRFLVTMDGDLTIKLGEGARMDFRSWLLSATQNGEGDFHGYMKYAGGGFDGMLSGQLSFLDGAVSATIPDNAMTMHVGGGTWYFYAGQKEGPRINVHLMIMDSNGYIMLDPNALAVGGGLHYYLNAGIGHISGDVDMGCAMTSQPHVSGYGEGNFEAKVCCCSVCVGPTITAGVSAGALPVSASAHGCVKIDLGIKTVKKCANFSL
ncbi:MAG: hypothetical protein PHU29_03905 [Sulfuricurvum sp.]|nr:hypothetical protein [Sulfuricurvum sp.]